MADKIAKVPNSRRAEFIQSFVLLVLEMHNMVSNDGTVPQGTMKDVLLNYSGMIPEQKLVGIRYLNQILWEGVI
jgi:hypothetical protein